MLLDPTKIRITLLVLPAVLLLYGCESNFKDVQKFNVTEFTPVGEAENFTMKYTDSGKIKAILVSKQMLDFSNIAYPFTEFPKGVDVTIFDNNAKKSYVVSDYAISYSQSDIIDLRGHVKVTSQDGKVLETSQLYFDQKREWFFTEQKCRFTSGPENVFYSNGFDANKDLSYFNAQDFTGVGQASDF